MDWGLIFSNTAIAAVNLEAVVFALAAIGLNMHFGYTGLLNFGQSAFLACGAYGLAVSVTQWGLGLWPSLLVGIGASVVLALLLGIPTLRLRADYLAIVTIAAAEIVRLILRSVQYKDTFGGSDGLQGFSDEFYDLSPLSPEATYGFGPWQFDDRRAWVLIVGWIMIAIVCTLMWLLIRSPWGRVIKGIREDEEAVRSLGKNVFAFKMQSLIIGGVIGALGGFIFAIGNAAVQPDIFGTDTTFFAYVVLILGGAGRILGPVLGAMIFWAIIQFTDNFLREAITEGYIPQSVMTTTQSAAVRFMLVGLALILLLIFRPQGILGDRKEIALDGR
jgi:branched-chain amino acid transport system permease protein